MHKSVWINAFTNVFLLAFHVFLFLFCLVLHCVRCWVDRTPRLGLFFLRNEREREYEGYLEQQERRPGEDNLVLKLGLRWCECCRVGCCPKEYIKRGR